MSATQHGYRVIVDGETHGPAHYGELVDGQALLLAHRHLGAIVELQVVSALRTYRSGVARTDSIETAASEFCARFGASNPHRTGVSRPAAQHAAIAA